MVSSKETTPAAYLASLPPERRDVIAKVRSVVKQHLPKGFVESMNWGMLAYEVPLSRYPVTYNKQPLMYAALAAQKNNYALYLTLVHDPAAMRAKLEAAYKAAGRKLDMGQSCLRFKRLDELPLEIIGDIIASTSVDQLIARYEASQRTAPKTSAKSAAVRKAPAKKAASRTPATQATTKRAAAKKSPAKKAAAKKAPKKP